MIARRKISEAAFAEMQFFHLWRKFVDHSIFWNSNVIWGERNTSAGTNTKMSDSEFGTPWAPKSDQPYNNPARVRTDSIRRFTLLLQKGFIEQIIIEGNWRHRSSRDAETGFRRSRRYLTEYKISKVQNIYAWIPIHKIFYRRNTSTS